jgi:hypothetical protein
MISGNGNSGDYLEYMTMVLRFRERRAGQSEAEWITSMVAGLSPEPGKELNHNPVLVLDKFNSPRQDGQNIGFANSFSCFVYKKSINSHLRDTNKDVAKALLELNQWQKIVPLPRSGKMRCLPLATSGNR